MGPLVLFLLSAPACTSGHCPGDSCDSAEPASCDVVVDSLTQEAVPASPQVLRLGVSLTAAASVAVDCRRADHDEVQLWEGDTAQDHALVLAGLLPQSTFDCRATPVCDGLPGVSRSFSFQTAQRNGAFPAVEVVGDPGQSFVQVNHARFCNAGQPLRLLVFDPQGQIRWSYDGIPDEVSVSIGHQYLGGGRFFWGGGESEEGDPSFVDLSGEVLSQVAFPGSDALSWHHEARVYPNGQILTMADSTNGNGEGQWEGIGLRLYDPETEAVSWSWDTQQAVDAGTLSGGRGDVYHGNWAGVDQDAGKAYVSLCGLAKLAGIDMATGELEWLFGKGGDFSLVDPAGAPLGDSEFPQCQHGLEVDGDTFLFYDNGGARGETRIAEYSLDIDTRVATRNWWWTEPDFYEPSLGDADYLDDGHVLIGRGHVECVGGNPGSVSEVVNLDPLTGETPWRLRFTDVQDTIYRAGVIDPCDVFGSSLYCPGVAERLEALGL